MKARQIPRELRRLMRQEVPRGEPDLWPEIRQRVERSTSSAVHTSNSGDRRPNRRADFSFRYVWRADDHGGHFGSTLRITAVFIAVLLVGVAVVTTVNSRYLGNPTDAHHSQLPPVAASSATTSVLASMQQCATYGGATLLAKFVDAFNQNNQTTLKALVVDQPLSADSWIAAVTSPSETTTGDIFTDSQSGFLAYVADRHRQGERLRVAQVIDVHPTWLPGYLNVVADLQRTALDLPSQQVRVVAMLSCGEQQIGAWSLGAVVDTSNALNLTGDALIADTLRQRPLHTWALAFRVASVQPMRHTLLTRA